jgi:ABC-type transport system substrate-binding protein
MNKIYTVPITVALAVGLLTGCTPTATPKHASTAANAAASTPVDITTETGVGDPTTFPPVTPPKPKAPAYTLAQEQARLSAMDYLSMGSGFSRAGLIEQLSSSAGEGFKKADATFAVDHITVNWNKQAVLSAKGYLSMGGFSRSSLIEQLTSQYGEQFTLAQATYAANHVGL